MDEQTAPETPHPDTRPVEGLRPELLAALVLRRALGGGVVQVVSDIYMDYGYRMGSYLAGTFAELIEGGLLALADEDDWGLRRVRVTDAGRVRYAQVQGIVRGTQQ